MSEQENSNAQIEPSKPATPAAPSLEELQAKVVDLERAREGLIRDVQQERSKRQELETRIPAPTASSPAPQDVNGDELRQVLNPYIAPLMKEIESLKAQSTEAQAMEFLSSKTGKSKADLMADVAFQDKLVKTAKKWNIAGSTLDVATRAYELMLLEESAAKDAERSRQARASETASLPAGAPPAPRSSSKEYSADEFNSMPPRQFGELAKSGDFKKVGDKFVYVPRT